jgi:hypothetical protein
MGAACYMWISLQTESCVVRGKIYDPKGIPSLQFKQWICKLHKVSLQINYPSGMQYKNWEDLHTPIFPWAVRFPLNHLTYGCPDSIPQWNDTLRPTTTVEFCGVSVRFSLYWWCSITTSAPSRKITRCDNTLWSKNHVYFWLFLRGCKNTFVYCRH